MAEEHRDGYDFDKLGAEPRAEVTLCLANPPERSDDDSQDFLNRMLDVVGPMGWRWSVLQIVDPNKRDAPPKNGEKLIEALDGLIEAAQSAREDVMSYSEITVDDISTWAIERAWRKVEDAGDELPEPSEEDEE